MRDNRITIDIIDNGYIVYYYRWNEDKNQWDEVSMKCCQDKSVLMNILEEHFAEVPKGDG